MLRRLFLHGLFGLSAVLVAGTEDRVADLMARMTLEEKISQLVQCSSNDELTGPRGERSPLMAEIRAGRVGSLLNVVGARETRRMQEAAVTGSRLHIPLLFGLDVIHGFRTTFPVNLGQAASWDLAAIERAERVAAIEASAAGVHWTFAPMVDIARDPRWGRISEGAGEDPFLGSAVAKARVRGFQGDLSGPTHILACAKHFAAYGAAQAGRDYWTTEVPEITLRDTYLPPFKAAAEVGVATFMCAFNDLNGVPCSGNRWLLDQVLRKEWGFQGIVVSDWGSIAEMVPHGLAADLKEAARLAALAGVDMDMEGQAYLKHLPELVRAGVVPMAQVDRMVKAVLEAKAKLGLFENPYKYCDEAREQRDMLRPEHLEAARDLARKSFVLLKHDPAVLPLRAGARVALVGPLADAARDQLGMWEAKGRPEDAVTLKAALEARLPGLVVTAPGCAVSEASRDEFASALKAAAQADVIVAALGESWDMTGEGHSRSKLDLPGSQQALLEALKATGKPVVLVLFAGRPLTLEAVLPQADAVLYAWQPGTMGGPALADVLLGDVSPSGKLPATFPRNVGQIPLYYNTKPGGRPQPAGPREQYRSNYLDTPNTPLFPFGFGLSYTRFAYTDARLSSPEMGLDGRLTVQATLRNLGDREGDEVAQLYVRDLVGSVTRPVRELKGFQRVRVPKGGQVALSFELRASDLAFTHTDGSFAPEAGRFQVFLGGDANAPLVGEFTLRAQ
ncbi:beta-glucosidase BglX [Geothrix sp. PMB-07]|uniref:beta-glucosidase BglX n=1 Tax=Geothrix sp. PMB-07 TaxID=3068640 RepID=UPI0027425D50|nr:beta-glucosidase BglX [Geothrix sp. PMB-07]WLT32364.1 beta-glucosidase BglX [Geothrix sp. PMB-07]